MTIEFDLEHDLDLEFFKVKYGIYYNSATEMVPLSWDEKQKCCSLSSDHETMRIKHIDWILGTKCNYWIWPWPWFWPWIFKVIFCILYFVSGIGGPIVIEQNGVIYDHDCDVLVTEMRWRDLPDSHRVTSDVGVPSTRLAVSLLATANFQALLFASKGILSMCTIVNFSPASDNVHVQKVPMGLIYIYAHQSYKSILIV